MYAHFDQTYSTILLQGYLEGILQWTDSAKALKVVNTAQFFNVIYIFLQNYRLKTVKQQFTTLGFCLAIVITH